jgi:hypothetical protein
MLSDRTFRHMTIEIDILSDAPMISNVELLSSLAHLCEAIKDSTDGQCDATWDVTCDETLDAVAAVNLALVRGSEPEYFGLDDYGNDVEDTEAE